MRVKALRDYNLTCYSAAVVSKVECPARDVQVNRIRSLLD